MGHRDGLLMTLNLSEAKNHGCRPHLRGSVRRASGFVLTGIAEVAQVVFVRKSMVEVQYLRTTITNEQRQEFGRLVEGTIRRIESADFPLHSGIRFPQNPCSTCPYVGLCLGKQEMIDAAVVRRPGADS